MAKSEHRKALFWALHQAIWCSLFVTCWDCLLVKAIKTYIVFQRILLFSYVFCLKSRTILHQIGAIGQSEGRTAL